MGRSHRQRRTGLAARPQFPWGPDASRRRLRHNHRSVPAALRAHAPRSTTVRR